MFEKSQRWFMSIFITLPTLGSCLRSPSFRHEYLQNRRWYQDILLVTMQLLMSAFKRILECYDTITSFCNIPAERSQLCNRRRPPCFFLWPKVTTNKRSFFLLTCDGRPQFDREKDLVLIQIFLLTFLQKAFFSDIDDGTDIQGGALFIHLALPWTFVLFHSPFYDKMCSYLINLM